MPKRSAALVVIGWMAAAVLLPGNVRADDGDLRAILRFAAEVAQKGDWREARFRWEQADRLDRDNPRILNNLGVAHELLGEPAKAKEYYERALSLSGHDPLIAENTERAARFWRTALAAGARPAPDPSTAPAERAESAPKRARGGAIRVPIHLPLPARLDLSKMKTLLVASFLSNETALMDSGREIVRFLRGEFRKHSSLKVLDVVPPPAVPEQTVPDLIANAEFWKHLGREFGADLITSGVIQFSRREASGFEDVDTVSSVTGQKVRQTQFVEQERFTYEVEYFFFDGATGGLLFRDRIRRSALFRGLSNDPITAFYQLSETIASDVLAVVSPRTREDVRAIFKS